MTHSTRAVELLLGAFAAAICLATAVVFWHQVPQFPLPGLYLIEISIAGVAPLFALALKGQPARVWGSVPWIAAGVLAAFAILGMWTVGVMLAPAALCVIVAAVLAARRTGDQLRNRVAILVMAAVVQGGIMWTVFTSRP